LLRRFFSGGRPVAVSGDAPAGEGVTGFGTPKLYRLLHLKFSYIGGLTVFLLSRFCYAEILNKGFLVKNFGVAIFQRKLHQKSFIGSGPG